MNQIKLIGAMIDELTRKEQAIRTAIELLDREGVEADKSGLIKEIEFLIDEKKQLIYEREIQICDG